MKLPRAIPSTVIGLPKESTDHDVVLAEAR